MNPDCPIEITPDYGHIGNLWWVNSSTMPYMDLLTYWFVRHWGTVFFGPPRPDISYTRRIPEPQQ